MKMCLLGREGREKRGRGALDSSFSKVLLLAWDSKIHIAHLGMVPGTPNIFPLGLLPEQTVCHVRQHLSLLGTCVVTKTPR